MFLKGFGGPLTYFLGGGWQPKGQRVSLKTLAFSGIALHFSVCPSRKVYGKLGSELEKFVIPLLGTALFFYTFLHGFGLQGNRWRNLSLTALIPC